MENSGRGWPNIARVLPNRGERIVVIEVDKICGDCLINLWHLDPHGCCFGPIIPELDFVTQLGAITIDKAEICAAGLYLVEINVGCRQLDQNRKISQILATARVIKGDFCAVLPISIPPAELITQQVTRVILYARPGIGDLRYRAGIQHAIIKGNVNNIVIGNINTTSG